MPLFVYRDVQWHNKVVYIRMLIVDEAEGEKRTDETEEKLNNDSRGDTTDKREHGSSKVCDLYFALNINVPRSTCKSIRQSMQALMSCILARKRKKKRKNGYLNIFVI